MHGWFIKAVVALFFSLNKVGKAKKSAFLAHKRSATGRNAFKICSPKSRLILNPVYRLFLITQQPIESSNTDQGNNQELWCQNICGCSSFQHAASNEYTNCVFSVKICYFLTNICLTAVYSRSKKMYKIKICMQTGNDNLTTLPVYVLLHLSNNTLKTKEVISTNKYCTAFNYIVCCWKTKGRQECFCRCLWMCSYAFMLAKCLKKNWTNFNQTTTTN